jgi:PST family polysaccharide transporter
MAEGGFTVRNLGFVGTAQVVTILLSSLIILILTRFLSPTDFGIYAICLVVFNLAVPLTTMGLDSAVIHYSGEVEQAYETATTIRLILGIFAATVILVLAPQLSLFFRHSNLTLAILVIVLATIMAALSFESMTRLSRNLNFKAVSISRIVSSVCGSMGALLLALLGLGYLSLPLGLLLGSIGLLLSLWIFQPWGIRHRIDGKVARPLLRYGAYIIGTSFLVLLAYNVDKLVVGKVLGSVVLGAYWMAYTYGTLMPNIFTGAVSTVMFPTFARAQHDITRMRGQYFSAMKYLAWASIPIGIGVTSVSATFVHVLLGPSWYEVTLPLAAFSILGIIMSLTSPASSVLMATGHPDVMFKQTFVVSIPYFVFLLPVVTYAGVLGISLLFVAIAVVSYSWISVFVARILQCSILEVVRPLILPLIACIPIVPICMVAQTMLGQSLLSLAVQVTLGAGSYAALMTLLTKGTFISELRHIGRRLRDKPE